MGSTHQPGWDDAAIVRAVLADYPLPRDGPHGVAHWARVLENGLGLAELTGADPGVVRLFALLHDSRRADEGADPEHGPRAAEFARVLRGRLFDLDDARFALLHRACAGHTRARTDPDVTVRTCYDADRLDLGRVGITPDPALLCTPEARRPEVIRRSHGRAVFGVIPGLVATDWGIVPRRRGR